MFFRLLNDVLFRQYSGFGYITDNSMFGYRFLNDNATLPGEKFVSESGSIMLSALNREPKYIDDIVNSLLCIFEGIGFDDLKNDTAEFYMQFVSDGFLACGETFNECKHFTRKLLSKNASDSNVVKTEGLKKGSLNNLLRSIHIEIINECNERCVHCYIPHELKNKVLDSNLFYKIIEQGKLLNILNVTLSGGEPLLHKDFLLFLKRCRELDLSVNVLSNLTLLTDEIIEEMKKNPRLSVQTSIYSIRPEIHDLITNKTGSLEKTKEAVCKLVYADIPVQISCPIMVQNKNEFSEVIKWGESKNIAVLIDYVIFAGYDHSNSNLKNRLSVSEVEEAFRMRLSNEYITDLIGIAQKKEAESEDDPICSICRYFFCVSAEGNVFPCVGWQSNIVGNLNNQTVKELWENSSEINKLRNIKRKEFKKCVACKDRGYCTVCMMSNSNENPDGNIYKIDQYHCTVASLMHKSVDIFMNKKA